MKIHKSETHSNALYPKTERLSSKFSIFFYFSKPDIMSQPRMLQSFYCRNKKISHNVTEYLKKYIERREAQKNQ